MFEFDKKCENLRANSNDIEKEENYLRYIGAILYKLEQITNIRHFDLIKYNYSTQGALF